jgi:hypothetical protein
MKIWHIRVVISLCALAVSLLLSPRSQAQTIAQDQAQKFAQYSVGKEGTKDYEEIEFWIENNRRGRIEYSYGTPIKSLALDYLGSDQCQGSPCFKVQFSNHSILYVTPQGSNLRITDGKGRYKKLFQWQYEGPVDGIGTFCSLCAADADEAMALIKQHFMQ